MRRIIPVSFKNTTKEIELYSFLRSLEEQSDFIKTAIFYYIDNVYNKSKQK